MSLNTPLPKPRPERARPLRVDPIPLLEAILIHLRGPSRRPENLEGWLSLLREISVESTPRPERRPTPSISVDRREEKRTQSPGSIHDVRREEKRTQFRDPADSYPFPKP